MFPRLHGFATAITVLTFWIAGGACKKQEGTSGDVAAPQAATPAESEVLAAEPEAGAAEPDAGTAEAVEPEPAKGGCGCMHGEGPHEGCPHHGGDSGAPGGCGCMHGEGSHEGCPHHGGDGGAPGGCGCMHGEGPHEGCPHSST